MEPESESVDFQVNYEEIRGPNGFIDFGVIPVALQIVPQWVMWKEIEREAGKRTKVPFTTQQAPAAVNDPRTWTTFEQVCDAYEPGGWFDGVGFVLTRDVGIVGIDLDYHQGRDANPIFDEDGNLQSWAEEIIVQLDSYTELSPSEQGIHILVRGTLPPGRRRVGQIEVYDSVRYLTVTGYRMLGTPDQIQDRPDSIAAFWDSTFNTGGSSRVAIAGVGTYSGDPNIPLISKTKARQLATGNWSSSYESQSEADLALCVYWAAQKEDSDAAGIDKQFRGSGLMRPKWDEPHYADGRTYGAETVAQAITRANSYQIDVPIAINGQVDEPIILEAVPDDDGSLPSNPSTAPNAAITRPETEYGNAERLAIRYGDAVRYVPVYKQWYVWDGRYWKTDEKNAVARLAKQTVRAIYEEAQSLTGRADRQSRVVWAQKSESRNAINNIIDLASSEPTIAVAPSELNGDPFLFTCLNGTIDLRTGSLKNHDRSDLITNISSVVYDADAPGGEWHEFLKVATDGDDDYIDFLQRSVGYSLTGDTREEVLFFVYGPAQTGKSSFIDATRSILGTYGKTADFESFLVQQNRQVRDDIADLAESRLVSSQEVSEGRRLAVGLVKLLTGGDPVKSRFLYAKLFEYVPRFKLWLVANHSPQIRAADDAVWRRIRRLPFEHVIPKDDRDNALKIRLRTPALTGPEILRWAVEGCLKWQQDGLNVPARVEKSTLEYREEEDQIAQFIDAYCTMDKEASVVASVLFRAYQTWARSMGYRGREVLTATMFGIRIKARFSSWRSNAGIHYSGVGLQDSQSATPSNVLTFEVPEPD